MNIGARIKLLRDSRGWSQTRLVEEARRYIPDNKVLARETMSRIENGHRPPDLWVLNAIAKALDMTPGEIIDDAAVAAPNVSGGDTQEQVARSRGGRPTGDVAGLIVRLDLLPDELRYDVIVRLNALLDVWLNVFEGVALSENERELLKYLREASPEKREAIHRLIAAAADEGVAEASPAAH